MKNEIAQAIKAKLVEMAINGELDGDINQLDISKFDEALKPLEEAVSLIKTVRTSCEEGADGTWDSSTNEGKEGFNDMITLLDEAIDKLK